MNIWDFGYTELQIHASPLGPAAASSKVLVLTTQQMVSHYDYKLAEGKIEVPIEKRQTFHIEEGCALRILKRDPYETPKEGEKNPILLEVHETEDEITIRVRATED
jgi:hypothetical protein